MKKTLSLALVVLMVVAAFSVFTIGSSADASGDGWTLKNGVFTLSKDQQDYQYDAAKNIDTFPWAQYRGDIKELVIEDAVTKIGERAFTACTELTKVTSGKNCASFGADALSGCTKLETIVFGCRITSFGQGVVYQDMAIKNVTLTNQSLEDFKAVSTVASYNWKEKGGLETGFDTAKFTVTGDVDPVVHLTLTAAFGKIENWPVATPETLFIVSGVAKDTIQNLFDKKYSLKNVTITDETANKTYLIPEYFFDAFSTRNNEANVSNSLLRLAVCHYGIVPVVDHAYTVSLEIYEGETKLFDGASAKGAFADSTNEGFKTNGAIVPDQVPHSYVEPAQVLNVEPKYGKIENWSGKTWFIVGGTNKDITDQLKAGTLSLKVVIVDETAKTTYTISKYAFDNASSEIYSDGSFLRIAACEYRIVPVADHEYTITLEIYDGTTLKYEGTSEKGAFKSTQTGDNNFPENGAIEVENPPHAYDEYKPPVVDDPPAGGEHTAMIAVLAIVALFGSAVVVSKKVLSK